MEAKPKMLAKFKMMIDSRKTFLSIKPGTSLLVKTRYIKGNRARSLTHTLNKAGYHFETSEKGLIDEIKITRHK
ncbi:MAG: hypothetical protein LBR26_15965 [Prevotella sp.]|nr:hypothetical protein [Prevotella sp.]